jgi:hypothetical protein
MRPGRGAIACLLLALTLAGCTGGEDETAPITSPPSDVAEPAARPFTLRPGHCWFEPVTIHREIWHVEPADQFGWGDGVRWRGKGVLRQVADDHLVFVDATGRRIDLWPDGHPTVAFDEDAPLQLCY